MRIEIYNTPDGEVMIAPGLKLRHYEKKNSNDTWNADQNSSKKMQYAV